MTDTTPTAPDAASAAPATAAPVAPSPPAPPPSALNGPQYGPQHDPQRDLQRDLQRDPSPRASVGAVVPWLVGLGVVALGAGALSWQTHGRLRDLEKELVRRQTSSQALAEDAKRAAQTLTDQLRDMATKQSVAEAKLAEVALQRAQLEDLLQSFSRSRDENIVSDLEASLRLASQQMVLVGSAEPLLAALRQADERLQRQKVARLEGVRRALLRDLDRLKAVSAVDPGTLALRLDEVSRLIDELPLLSEPQRREPRRAMTAVPAPPEPEAGGVWQRWLRGSRLLGQQVWEEAKGLIRVTRIEHPEAMLLTPEQGFLLRENLKLRLLNARLALLSRHHEAARQDLAAAQQALRRHADARQRRTQIALELIDQVLAQARPVAWPRPDDSLAALAAAAGVVR